MAQRSVILSIVLLTVSLIAGALPAVSAARERHCSYRPAVDWPGVDELRARRTTCKIARGVADNISMRANLRMESGKQGLPHRVPPGAGMRPYRCRYPFVKTRDGGYMRALCTRGRKRVTMRLTS